MPLLGTLRKFMAWRKWPGQNEGQTKQLYRQLRQSPRNIPNHYQVKEHVEMMAVDPPTGQAHLEAALHEVLTLDRKSVV